MLLILIPWAGVQGLELRQDFFGIVIPYLAALLFLAGFPVSPDQMVQSPQPLQNTHNRRPAEESQLDPAFQDRQPLHHLSDHPAHGFRGLPVPFPFPQPEPAFRHRPNTAGHAVNLLRLRQMALAVRHRVSLRPVHHPLPAPALFHQSGSRSRRTGSRIWTDGLKSASPGYDERTDSACWPSPCFLPGGSSSQGFVISRC